MKYWLTQYCKRQNKDELLSVCHVVLINIRLALSLLQSLVQSHQNASVLFRNYASSKLRIATIIVASILKALSDDLLFIYLFIYLFFNAVNLRRKGVG